jgi:outer membrane immunogenic protein
MVILSSAVQAADVAVQEGSDWSGFFMGVNAGANMSQGDLSTSTSHIPYEYGGYFNYENIPLVNDAGDRDFSQTSFTGGVQAGYNWQLEGILLGLEADVGYAGVDASVKDGAAYLNDPSLGFDVKQDLSLDWLGTARAKVGLVADDLLFYGTGGLAFGTVDYQGEFSDSSVNDASSSSSTSEFKVGWTAGGGVDWMMFEKTSLKLEYLYYDLGNVNADGVLTSNLDLSNKFDHEADVSGSIVRLGLNWHLN